MADHPMTDFRLRVRPRDGLKKIPLVGALLICVPLVFLDGRRNLNAEAAEEQAPPAFAPAEISIGEPIQLPTGVVPGAAVRDGSADTATPGTGGASGARSGWIGLTADDSLVPGRLVVVDVAQPGPAAQAGIRPQDQLLAINGKQLRSSDQLAAELAAIAPGNDVKVAVGRADRIDEIVIRATDRPLRTVAPARSPELSSATSSEWQSGPATAASAFGPASAADSSSLPPVPVAAVPSTPPAVATPSYVPPAAVAPAYLPAHRLAEPAPLSAPLASDPPQRSVATLPNAMGRTALGVRTLPVDTSVQARFGLSEPAGALVIGVVQDLPASKAGVPPGSVIVALGNQAVRSPNELTKLVTSSPAGRPITLQYILPGGEQRRAEVSLQSLEVPLERVLVGPDR